MNMPVQQPMTLPPQFPKDGVDAVDLGDCVIFMSTHDKFYRGCVSEARRGAPIEMDQHGNVSPYHRPSAVSAQTIATVTDARYGLYLIFHHLITRKLAPTCVDATPGNAHICIRYGNLFRTLGYEGKARYVESSPSSDLLPFTSKINGLERYIEPIAENPSINRLLTDSSNPSVFIHVSSIGALAEIEEPLLQKPNVLAFEMHASKKDSVETLSKLLNTHILFDVGFLYRPFCFSAITTRDVRQFTRIVANYPHRATHIVAISRDVPEVNDLAYQLACLMPGPVEYSLAMEPHLPQSERQKPRLAEQVEVLVVPERSPLPSPIESPFYGDMPVPPVPTTPVNLSRSPAS